MHNDELQYRSIDRTEGKAYCALSDKSCPFYMRVRNHEYCRTYTRSGETGCKKQNK